MRKFLKRFILTIIALLSFLLIGIVFLLGYIFWNPEAVINEKYLKLALDKTHILKEYSWSAVSLEHERLSWNKRVFKGEFHDLCFKYINPTTEVASCMEEFLWNFEISWSFTGGLKVFANRPLTIDSSLFKIDLLKSTSEAPVKEEEVNYLAYWDMIWQPMIPDANINLRRIEFNNDVLNNPNPLVINAHLIKVSNELKLSVREFQLDARPKSFHLYAPHRVKIPQDFIKNRNLYIDKIGLFGKINSNSVDLSLNANVEQANLVISTSLSKQQISQELMKPDVQTEILKNTKAKLYIKNLNESLSRILPVPYNVLPAPINAMEGDLVISMNVSSYLDKTSVSLDFLTVLDLKGPKQRIHLNLLGQFPFDLKSYALGAMNLALDIKELRLLLPNLAKNKLPPKLIPDSRIQVASKVKSPPPVKKDPIHYDLAVKALGSDLITLNSNLLDNPLKMNLEFLINDGNIEQGFIKTRPLKTTFFKRNISIESLLINFKFPLGPTLDAFINFDLPEYLVKLHLEGPLTAPRMVLSSEPPLPQSDIYAVLLFGRPMSDLAGDDSSAAQNTSKIISQGVLSLAVLYYLAGSPIEAIGYDAESNEVSAQIGLGAKNSLRVGGTDTGLNSAGVRRSLGKGWYIDSSIQKSTETANGSNFGVLLERIIAY